MKSRVGRLRLQARELLPHDPGHDRILEGRLRQRLGEQGDGRFQARDGYVEVGRQRVGVIGEDDRGAGGFELAGELAGGLAAGSLGDGRTRAPG